MASASSDTDDAAKTAEPMVLEEQEAPPANPIAVEKTEEPAPETAAKKGQLPELRYYLIGSG
jgi:hypothetical protein